MNNGYDIRLDNGHLLPTTRPGVDYQLHYSYVPASLIGQPEEKVNTKHGIVIVGISDTLCHVWQVQDDDLVKILYEYARQHVIELAEEGALGGTSSIQMTTYNASQQRPFDPARIQFEFDKPIRVEMPKKSPLESAEPAALPSQIIDLRDSINAIFGEKFKGRILRLPQERHIVELFKECRDHETFAYRVTSLGGLATAISVDDLKRLINRKAPEKQKVNRLKTETKSAVKDNLKPLDILGIFLRLHFKHAKVNSLMETMKNFNSLRRMYPVHTDRADGVLSAHQYFGLDYPIKDHAASGRRLLEVYRDMLEKLIALLKEPSIHA